MIARLRAGGLAGRIVALLAGAIIAANLLAFAVMSFQRDALGQRARDDREVERIAALVPSLEAVPEAARSRIARQASTRFARVRVAPVALVRQTAPDRRSQAIARQLAETLSREDIAVALVDRPARHSRQDDNAPGWRAQSLVVSVPFASAAGPTRQWLNVVTTSVPAHRDPAATRFPAAMLAASLVAVLVVSVILARLLTRPLAELSQAARAAGQGDRTARVPETGPREMRDAAAAFNAMQGEIARFDAERMRYLASVGHDLRTPITSLRIRAEMLDDPQLREPMIRTLDEMTVMADGLVIYGREGREAEEMQEVDLAPLLRQLCDDRGASCDDLPALRVNARPVGLSRAIGNLIDNALRYGGAARAGLHAEGARAVITVSDNGPGIPPDRMDEMLRPFTRGEDSRSAETGGAGLGLSIARSIIVAHGGTLILENRPEGGLIAKVSLPLSGPPTSGAA